MEEPIACSPEEVGVDGRYYRKMVFDECSPDCKHYLKCLAELDLKHYTFTKWEEVDPSDEDINNGTFFYNNEGRPKVMVKLV